MRRNRQESAAETREALIAAGMVAFGAEGLDASLDGICARAGYTRGAFYVHFRDRDDFLVAVMDRAGAAFLDAMFAGGGLPDTVERFLAAVSAGAYPLMRPGGVAPHQLLEACARSSTVRARYVGLIETSLDHLARLTKSPEHAQLIMAAVIGAGVMIELGLSVEPRRLAHTFMRLLEKQPAPRSARGRRSR
jgi:AcrR family transcriptional regulator